VAGWSFYFIHRISYAEHEPSPLAYLSIIYTYKKAVNIRCRSTIQLRLFAVVWPARRPLRVDDENLQPLRPHNKVSSRVAFIKRLAGLSRRCSFNVLRTSASALLLAPAEYCYQAWCQTAHTHKLGSRLNDVMRTISGYERSTPTDFLPFLCGILPLTTRRNMACLQLRLKTQSPDHMLQATLYSRFEISSYPRHSKKR